MVKLAPVVILFTLSGLPNSAHAENWRALLSPGPVAKGHQEVAGTCDKCHLVFKGVPDEKCLACHGAIDELVRESSGFHGSVGDQACIACHDDHKGADHSQIRPEAREAFDHDATRFELRGAHAKLECRDCHAKPLEQMGDSCAGCHEDYHRGTLGSDCARCHGATSWASILESLDDHDVSMDGGHEGLGCADCHQVGKHLSDPVPCADCHEQAHGGTEAACDDCHSVAAFKPAKFDHDLCPCAFPGKHKTAPCLSCHVDFKFTDTPLLCSGCHAKDLTHDDIGECSQCHSALSWKSNRFNHNRQSRFRLSESHLEVDCFQCHKEKRRGKTAFKRAPKRCAGCHAQSGAEAHGDFGACEKCHTTEGFDKSTFDHAKTGFPLDGQHDKINCQKCHAQKTDGYRKSSALPQGELDRSHTNQGRSDRHVAPGRWSVLSALFFGALPDDDRGDEDRGDEGRGPAVVHGSDNRACKHCHESPHQGTAQDPCTSCHVTEQWAPSTFDGARHARTPFPLGGAHAETKCALCHVDSQLTGLPKACAGCHVDVHQGKFGSACESCHGDSAFSPAAGFDHASTGFPLAGSHVEVGCLECHGPGGEEDSTAVAAKEGCGGCHALGHGPELGADCTRCHLTADKSFASADRKRFDHATTPFLIERRHQPLKCSQCHPAPVAGQPSLAPTGRCSTCHLDPHKGNNSNDCALCHQPDRWRLARFDHDLAGWPLQGRHIVAPCASCHTNQRWFGLTTDCFDCHALDAARGASVAPGLHQFGPLSCPDCHFNGWTWRML